MKNFILSILLTLTSIFSFSQISDAELSRIINSGTKSELIFYSSELLQNKKYYQAELMIDKLLKEYPQSSNFNYKKGFVILVSTGNFLKAIPHLEIAVKEIDKNYDMFSENEKSSSIDSYYLLGNAYHMAGRVDEADKYFDLFLANSSKKNIMNDEARLKKAQIINARRIMAEPNPDVVVVNVGNKVNSEYPDYSPVISLDGTALYYTSRRPWGNQSSESTKEIYEDIYVSYLDEKSGLWGDPSRMEFCREEYHEASIAVSVDERRIYIYKDNSGSGDIYFSDFSSNHFSIIAPDDRDGVNTENWETHCTVSIDGKNLFFVSERLGGFGGRDIYQMTRLQDGSWTEPKNLGSTVNTKYDEDGAFIAVDGKTLYFSSNGETSMGGFDVYSTKMDNEGNWSSPINLGYPLNTCGDEIYYTTTIDGRKGYYTSFREDGYGEKDIYEIQHNYVGDVVVSVVEGTIKTVNNSALPEDVAVYLKCLDCEDEETFLVKPRLRDGVFYHSVEPCHKYEMIYHYANGDKILFKDYFTTICNQNIAVNERNILLNVEDPTNIFVTEEPALISGVITTNTGEKLPSDLTMIASCNACEVKNTEFKISQTGTYGATLEAGKEYTFTYAANNGRDEYLIEKFTPVKGENIHNVIIDLKTRIQDVVEVGDFKNLEMKHYFSYNANKLSPSKGEFRRFMNEVEKQLKNGRQSITIKVYSSASYVPTNKFKDNTELAKTRAENVKYDIVAYLQNKAGKYSSKVNVVIVEYSVNGPVYENDRNEKTKYEPFQFIHLITE